MIDTHAHLDDHKFDCDREQLISEFEQNNITFVINNSCDFEGMTNGFELSQNHDRIFCTVGMHPYYPEQFNDEFKNFMIEKASNPKVVAVGEIGLDYHLGGEDRQAQKDLFACQLEMADKLGLPVTLHVRDAYQDAVDVLTSCKKYLNNPVVWHCYSGSAEFAKPFVKQGHYFALGGVITFAHKSDVIRAIPPQQILTETDCPYMTPLAFRGKRNEPKYIKFVLEKLAKVYDMPYHQLEDVILQNALRVFSKIKI